MAPVVGYGYLIANDVLTNVGYTLIEPAVGGIGVPLGGITAGTQTVNIYDPSMYVGAQIVVGIVLSATLEVVTITAVNVGVSFTATFAFSHNAGEPIVGATFPVRQTTDPFFTQPEMLAYLSTAVNDFLTECPLAYVVNPAVAVAPTAQVAPLPSDCMEPTRIAYLNYPLRETSQARLDQYNWQWQGAAPSGPVTYFRDKVGLQNFGIWPRANLSVSVEVTYKQRGPQVMGLADGFNIVDPMLVYIKARVLEFAYSKDGEQRNPGLAKYWGGRYAMGVKICRMFLDAMMDPNLQMGQ